MAGSGNKGLLWALAVVAMFVVAIGILWHSRQPGGADWTPTSPRSLLPADSSSGSTAAVDDADTRPESTSADSPSSDDGGVGQPGQDTSDAALAGETPGMAEASEEGAEERPPRISDRYRTPGRGAPEPNSEAAHAFGELRCSRNLKELALAFKIYSTDYDEQFPIASRWCDITQPYAHSADRYSCPAAATEYDYALNARLDRRHERELKAPMKTVMLFESSTGQKNTFDVGSSLCNPPRHPDGNFFAYVDGHVMSSTEPQSFEIGER